MTAALLSAALLATAACGDDGNTKVPDATAVDAHAAGSDGAPDAAAAATKTITGAGTQHFFSPAGLLDSPASFTGKTVFGFSPDGGGGWAGRAGEVDDHSLAFPIDEGALSWLWTLADTHAGTYDSYQSSAATLDLGSYALGRPGVAYPTQMTNTELVATNMTAWRTGDQLELLSEGNGGTLFGAQSSLIGQFDVGETSLDRTLDWQTTRMPLVEAGDGLDVLREAQVTDSASGLHYLALTELAMASDLAQVDGEPATATLPFAPVARTSSFALDWRGSQFAAQQSAVTSGSASPPTGGITIDALPGARDHGAYGAAPDLATYAGTAADKSGTIEYATPFGGATGAWDTVVTAYYYFPVFVTSGSSSGTLYAGFYRVTNIDDPSLATIAPTLTPPTNVTVTGHDLVWSAPVTGTPTAYLVSLLQPQGSGAHGFIATLATFTVPASVTAFQIPAAFLSDGSSYVAMVTAEQTAQNYDGAPLVTTPGFARADAVTGLFTP